MEKEVQQQDQISEPKVDSQPAQSRGYGKNWKKWILIYILIGGLIYAGVYFFVLYRQYSQITQNQFQTQGPFKSEAECESETGKGCDFQTCDYIPKENPDACKNFRGKGWYPKSQIQSPQPTVDPTANWKTFTYEKRNFSFKYPQNLFVKQGLVDEYFSFRENSDDPTNEIRSQKLIVSIANNLSNKNIEQFLKENNDQENEFLKEVIEKEIINDLEFIKYKSTGCPAFSVCDPNDKTESITYYLKGNKFIIYFDLDSDPNSDAIYNEKWLKQILSTFKFFDENETIVMGKVIEHNEGCIVDAWCYLVLDVNGNKIKVVYNFGRTPPCLNTKASTDVSKIKIGDEVEAFGIYPDPNDKNTLSTCDSEKYYLDRL